MRFINVNSADLDAEIERVLGLMGSFLGGDRCANYRAMLTRPEFDPDMVSPKILDTLFGCIDS